jgi:SNF2 family DNA or RNA helicase
MPDYLGSQEAFRRNYELPIAQGGDGGEDAQTRLRRQLQPFLLRRIKRDVARELPPKIERIAYCALTPDQARVYAQLLEHSRRRIRDLVERDGFNASRMEVLTLLLRLRQACCHLELLGLPAHPFEAPSGKMDLLFELLDEAVDGGHRVLLFSQFVSMLTLLRRELEQRGWRYCYLDGQTKDRLDVVRTFNTQSDIPLFLVSLKAGGIGLNLTGADMVIHYDPWWNPAVEDQATDRAHRIGQQRTVYSVKLIARGTIEEKVLELQRRKQRLIEATIVSDEDLAGKMNREDIRELLDL